RRRHGGTPSRERDPSETKPRRIGTNPAIASSTVVFPAPDGPNSATRSPAPTDNAARTANERQSTSTSASSTGTPEVREQRQRQRHHQQHEGERQGGRQAGLLKRGEYLQRYPGRVIGDDHHRAERAH